MTSHKAVLLRCHALPSIATGSDGRNDKFGALFDVYLSFDLRCNEINDTKAAPERSVTRQLNKRSADLAGNDEGMEDQQNTPIEECKANCNTR